MKDWEIISLEEHTDAKRGNLYVAEFGKEIPFPVQRIYYMTQVPEGECRGGQRHRALQQVLIPIVGEFEVEVENDGVCEVIRLCEPNKGLYIAPHVKRVLRNFSSGAICLVLASEKYDASDNV